MSRYEEDDGYGTVFIDEYGYIDYRLRHRFDSEARYNAEQDAADLERIRRERKNRTIKDSLQVGGDE